MTITHLTLAQLEAGLDHIRQAPKDAGAVELIVRRPSAGARELIERGDLDAADGLQGDTWKCERAPGRRTVHRILTCS